MSKVREALELFAKSGQRIDGINFNGFITSHIRYGYGNQYGGYAADSVKSKKDSDKQ